jgi:deazaflavin-dependent oxidoreductase (nitroreductase family)
MTERNQKEALERERFVHLTTRGRKSGQPRTVELLFAYEDGELYLMARAGDGAGTQWYRNLRADGSATAEIGGFVWKVQAQPVGDEASALEKARLLFRQKYGEEAVHSMYESTSRLPVKLRVLESASSPTG